MNELEIMVMPDYVDTYKSGALDYALSCLAAQGSFHQYATWLKTQPVAASLNTEDWCTVDNKIVYAKGTEDEESYAPTAVIAMGSGDSAEAIFHSFEVSASFFFLLNEDNTMDALYVD